jgi:hypothetical protein
MSSIEKGSVEYLLALAQKLHDKHLLTTCIRCAHFNHELEMCKLCTKRPPAKVIALGCPQWQDDLMPF